MDLKRLQYFVTVADKGSVSAAARELFMSQPPLSMQIQALEEEMGIPLFDRMGKGMKLTEAGKTLYDRACTLLDLSRSLKNEIQDLRTGTAGTIRMGIVSSLCNSFFFQWIRNFCDQYQNVRLQLHEANTYQLLDMVRTNQVELAFVRTPFSAPDLKIRPFFQERICAVGQASFFEGVEGPQLSLKQLSKMPLMLYRRWEKFLYQTFQAAALSPRVVCINDDARTTLCLAETGLGVGIVPRSILHGSMEGMRFFPLENPALSSQVCAVFREDVYMSRITRNFLQFIPGVLQDTEEMQEKTPPKEEDRTGKKPAVL